MNQEYYCVNINPLLKCYWVICMDKKSPKRKVIRLKGYDYSQTGVYFVTICTEDRKNYFWAEVGAIIDRPQDIKLSAYGDIANNAINNISLIYPAVEVVHYVIMPNHIHLLLTIHSDEDGRPLVAPTISQIIKQLKGYISKQTGKPIFQRSFYDHIVRDQSDYQNIWQYIDTNPAKWQEDKYYNQ